MSQEKFSVIGSGLIGTQWAMIFASGGYRVSLYDVDQGQLKEAEKLIKKQLESFASDGVLRGEASFDVQNKLITTTSDLQECIRDAIYIQECVPENLQIKKKVFQEIDNLLVGAEKKAILASSASCIIPRNISDHLKARENFIVAHPVNPPYLLPLVEIIPAPWTSQETRKVTRELMTKVGQVPVSLNKEIEGFVLNRIQYSILNECWRLLADEVISVEDMDKVMTCGLGLRYSVIGPMEAIHLNAHGFRDYRDKYGESITDVADTFGPVPKAWKENTESDKKEVECIASQLECLYPLNKLKERMDIRDERLSKTIKLRRTLFQ